jgi:hypothetical protein
VITSLGRLRKLISEALSNQSETTYRSVFDIKNGDLIKFKQTRLNIDKDDVFVVNTSRKVFLDIETDGDQPSYFVFKNKSQRKQPVVKCFTLQIKNIKNGRIRHCYVCENVSAGELYDDLFSSESETVSAFFDISDVIKVGNQETRTQKLSFDGHMLDIISYVVKQNGPMTAREIMEKVQEFEGKYSAYDEGFIDVWFGDRHENLQYVTDVLQPVGKKDGEVVYDLNSSPINSNNSISTALSVEERASLIIPYLLSVNGPMKVDPLDTQARFIAFRKFNIVSLNKAISKAIKSGLIYEDEDEVYHLTDEGQVLGDKAQELWGYVLAQTAKDI